MVLKGTLPVLPILVTWDKHQCSRTQRDEAETTREVAPQSAATQEWLEA